VAKVTTQANVFLAGRPPMGEFIGFVTSQMVDGHDADVRVLSNQWRSANDHVKELEAREAGIADRAQVQDIPADLQGLVSKVNSDPVYLRSFEMVPTRLGMIELDTLVVYQKRINLDFVDSIKRALGLQPSSEDVFKTCLPFDHPMPPLRVARVAQNAFAFVSPSNDIRVVDAALLKPDQISNFKAHGILAGAVGLLVGFSVNYMQVIHVDGRLILGNGSHRAYALRDLGVTSVPAVVQEVTRRDELDVLGIQDVSSNPDRYLKEPRPPLLKDYFDDRLRIVVPVPRQDRQVKIAFGVEMLDVPGA
jgi:hypothetical protein